MAIDGVRRLSFPDTSIAGRVDIRGRQKREQSRGAEPLAAQRRRAGWLKLSQRHLRCRWLKEGSATLRLYRVYKRIRARHRFKSHVKTLKASTLEWDLVDLKPAWLTRRRSMAGLLNSGFWDLSERIGSMFRNDFRSFRWVPTGLDTDLAMLTLTSIDFDLRIQVWHPPRTRMSLLKSGPKRIFDHFPPFRVLSSQFEP